MRMFVRFRSAFCFSIAAAVLGCAMAVQAGTVLISNTSPVRILVPTNDIGESWHEAGPYDDSGWLLGTNGVGYETVPGHPGKVLADSVGEWSAAGRQGESRWVNGYYDKTADTNGAYNVNDFQPFLRMHGAPWSESNFWDGASWNWNPDFVPWDSIGPASIHPNGTNSGNIEHWAIRRWHATYTGPVTFQFHVRKTNLSGNGTTGKIFHNGTEIFSRTIAGNDGAGFTVYVNQTIAAGDVIDFAHTPVGTDGTGNDGADGSDLTARVYQGTIVAPTVVADSVADFGGVQGGNGWFYGYYDRGTDPDSTYSVAELNTTDPNWTFVGSSWALGPGDPPWSIIGVNTWHPNGPSPRHWVVRRWVSDVSGEAHARVRFAKQNTSCGNGVTLRVLTNGVQAAAFTIAGGDGTGIDRVIHFPSLAIGDVLDFALDSVGTDGDPQDGCDGSFFTGTISMGPPFVPGLADCINTDLSTIMRGSNSSVFLRIPFVVTTPSAIQGLQLKLKWNDGFEARLNGKAIDKRNAPTVLIGVTNADSIADWSTTGVQGENDWSYGYFNKSTDANGIFELGEMTPFPSDGAGYSPTDFWDGAKWDWFNGNPPWIEVGQEGTHPAHGNGAVIDPGNIVTHELWPMRRWVADLDGDLGVRFRFRKTSAGCGDGIIGKIFHNGVEVYSQSIAFSDVVGRDDVITITNVLNSDEIVFAVVPGGNDFCDSSAFSALIFSGLTIIPWNSAATMSRTKAETVAPLTYNLDSMIPDLVSGTNVLTIHALADNVNADDFLIAAELIANSRPTASNDALVIQQDNPTLIASSQLLANDADADGDELLVVGAFPGFTSAQGGSVRVYGNSVRYAPPSGFAGIDTFNYTMTDASGFPANAQVTVTVSSKRIARVERLLNGTGKIVMENVAPGVSWRIERSGVLPATTWDPVAGPQTADPGGTIEFIDATPLPGSAFYRAVLSP